MRYNALMYCKKGRIVMLTVIFGFITQHYMGKEDREHLGLV